MLTELHITNFAIIDRVDLAFSPGFNVLTGETGAGKSIIIDAVDMLLGGKAGQEVIRAGEAATEIEGVFTVTPQVADAVNPVLEREGLEVTIRACCCCRASCAAAGARWRGSTAGPWRCQCSRRSATW